MELERKTLDAEAETYARAYAWLKLIAFWTVLRGEDSTWIAAGSLKWDEKTGLQGLLAQSKTTGLDRKIKARTIQVSKEAYFLDPDWIKEGLKIWDTAPKNRQNFICLPADNLEDFRDYGAEPHDRAALTRWAYRQALQAASEGKEGCEK